MRELGALHADTARVEAVPQYGHWESQELAAAVPLARGWERQVDIERNPLFYSGTLTPAAYYGWLRYNAVRYVAISAASPDFAAVAEAAMVSEGQPWLVPVWHNGFWQLFRVAGTFRWPARRPRSPQDAGRDHTAHEPGRHHHRAGALVATAARTGCAGLARRSLDQPDRPPARPVRCRPRTDAAGQPGQEPPSPGSGARPRAAGRAAR